MIDKRRVSQQEERRVSQQEEQEAHLDKVEHRILHVLCGLLTEQMWGVVYKV